jgi:hypothetical protein
MRLELVFGKASGHESLETSPESGLGFALLDNFLSIHHSMPAQPAFHIPDDLVVSAWKNSGAPWTYDVNPDQVRLPNE